MAGVHARHPSGAVSVQNGYPAVLWTVKSNQKPAPGFDVHGRTNAAGAWKRRSGEPFGSPARFAFRRGDRTRCAQTAIASDRRKAPVLSGI